MTSKSQQRRLNVQRGGKPMTDEEYIRAGVELAEGFMMDASNRQMLVPRVGWTQFNQPIPSAAKDALAAQLVRQVDAVRSKSGYLLCVWQKPKSTTILDGEKLVCPAAGDRREMNTIRAIVDSGVLISEDGTMRTGRGKPAQGDQTSE